MTVINARRAPRLVAAVVLSAGLVASGLVLVARSHRAVAAPVSLTLNYTCSFPLIGAQPMSVVINADIPAQIAPGVATPAFAINAVATVSETARLGLRTLGATTLEGTVRSGARLSVPNMDLPLSVEMGVPQVPIPSASGPFPVNATGTTPSLTFTAQNAGTGTITVGDLVMTLTPKTSAGAATGLGTFDSSCTQGPGQNNVLQRITIGDGTGPTTRPVATTGPTTATTATTRPMATTTRPGPTTTGASSTIKLDYALTGEAFIASAVGTVPINGSIAANFDLAAGTHRSTLTLQPTQGKFKVAGLLNTTAKIEFVQLGDTTGSLVDGKLTAHAEMTIKLKNIVVLGVLPVGGGANCQTSTPVTIDLASPADQPFDPLRGGALSGTFTMPKLSSCGILGSVINIFVAGPDNTIDVQLTSAGR
jgi:hypothetical protein